MVLLYHRWVSPRLPFNSSNLESRNVLKQVLIKSREEFIYIYISPPLPYPRFSTLVVARSSLVIAHFIVYRITLINRWRVRREDGVNFVGRRGVRNGVYRSSARGDERKYHSLRFERAYTPTCARTTPPDFTKISINAILRHGWGRGGLKGKKLQNRGDRNKYDNETRKWKKLVPKKGKWTF